MKWECLNLALTFHIWPLDGHFYSLLAVIASREQKGVGGAEEGVSLAPRAYHQSAPRGMDTGDGFSCSSQTPLLLPPQKFAVGQISSGHGVTLRGKTSIQTDLASLEQFSGLPLPPPPLIYDQRNGVEVQNVLHGVSRPIGQ